MPSVVKYGSTELKTMRAVVLAGVDLDAQVVAGAEDVLLLDARSDSASFSALEKPAPSCRLPVGFSTTLMFRSTWSGAPGTSLVSTFTSLK